VSIEKGTPWGRPATGPADVTVEGDDVALAGAVARHPGARIAFVPAPGSDFAHAVGLFDASSAPDLLTKTTELPCDALRVEIDGREMLAVNMVVLGVPPDEQRWSSGSARVRVVIDTRLMHDGAALAVVVASGQYLRGNDIVPRGHPGDGRAEVHVYSLARGERSAMRDRLPLGVHLPHPRIRTASGRRVEIQAMGSSRPVEVDGVEAGTATEVAVAVVPAAFTLLV
jgi:YegS C-terminal NAD kinase beta sandwich-like domain